MTPIVVDPILVEHRRTLFSELSDVRQLPAGLTVADIVSTFQVPAEFASHGAVYLKRDRHDPGCIVERRYWHRIRPKPGTALFVSCVPQGGGGGKNIFAAIAAIALIALTFWVGGGALAGLFGPTFAAGTFGAQAAAAALAVAGSLALQALTPRPGGGTVESDAQGTTLGVAGIAQNIIRPFSQVPAPLGRIRISPPLVARPWTTVELTDQYVHLIAGVCGPAQISDIKINDTDLADLPATDIQVETREGWGDEGMVPVVDLGFEGSDQSTVIRDKARATREWTAAGNAHIEDGALVLDGSDDFAAADQAPELELGDKDFRIDITAEITDAGGATRGLAGKGLANTGTTAVWTVARATAGFIFGAIYVGSTEFNVNTGATTYTSGSNPGPHDISFRRAGNVLQLWVDDVLMSTAAVSGAANAVDSETSVGRRSESGQFFQGRVHDMRISIDGAEPELTLIRDSVFEESTNLEMGKHRLDNDQTTLLEPFSESYPSKHILRTAREPDEFRVTLGFPQGLTRFDSTSQKVLLALRIRLRRVGDAAWRNLPEVHFEGAIRAPFRQTVRLFWRAPALNLAVQQPLAVRFYAQNPEWTAEPWFNAAPASIDTTVAQIFAGTSEVLVFLTDTDEWPRGQYDVEVQRGFVQDANAGEFSGANYLGGLFTFRTAGPPQTIPSQSNFSSALILENHATVRRQYPIAQSGLALIAVRAKNLRINSISAEFEPYVPVPSEGSPVDWDTIEPSSNPAALVRWVRTGSLNKRPSDPDLAQGLEDFYDHCETHGLHCSAVVADGSVEQAAALAANVGDGIIRESDKWGVVIDRDRTGEGIAHLFGAHNMTAPLTMQRRFLLGARGIVPQFSDADQDYAVRELLQPVYDDGVSEANDDMLIDAVPYDGYSSEALVRRRAKLDLRRARLRSTRYGWECHQEHLVAIHGDLVGLSHDILAYVFGGGRVQSFTTETVGSPSQTYLRTVTLNTEVLDVPDWPLGSPAGIFEVPDVFLIGDMFTLSAPELGLLVRLPDNAIATLPVEAIDGAVITIEGDVPVPDGFERTLLAAVGPRTKEIRRVLITAITPRRDHFARIEAVDEAPAIHAGL